jgi:peptidoglycan/LPS O-acetylase OafA/YrhL
MVNERSAALDLSRFVAALIVFLGHMLFLPKYIEASGFHFFSLDFIRTGDTAVLFFFALSGCVLAPFAQRDSYFQWTKRRILRLYPVYISAWLFGLVVIAGHKANLVNAKLLIFGILGIQSSDKELYLVVNPPLWSLSVEIIFAFFLYYLIRLRGHPYLLLFILSAFIALPENYLGSPILRAAPYFIIGILTKSNYVSRIQVRSIYGVATLGLVGILYLYQGATWILGLPYSVYGETQKLFMIGLLIIIVSSVKLEGALAKNAIALGKRSFCIYAFHYPLLLIFNFLIRPETGVQFSLYLALSLISTFAVSEIAFRVIDLPSTKKPTSRAS